MSAALKTVTRQRSAVEPSGISAAVLAAAGRGTPAIYRRCMRCGGKLPCIDCARAVRRERGLVGKEPPAEELALDPAVEEAARKIRLEGFSYTDRDGATIARLPWTEQDHRLRAGEALRVEVTRCEDLSDNAAIFAGNVPAAPARRRPRGSGKRRAK